jgi:hypothetical protein
MAIPQKKRKESTVQTVIRMDLAAHLGAFSDSEFYSLEAIAAKLNRDRDWVRNTFIRPVDHNSKKRLLDENGVPVAGVRHFRHGAEYLISGRILHEWIIEHSEVHKD